MGDTGSSLVPFVGFDPALGCGLDHRVLGQAIGISCVLEDEIAHLNHREQDRGGLSQVDGVRQHPLRDPWPQSRLGGDVHIAAQQVLEVHEEPTQVEQASLFVELHQEVNITGR